MIYTLIIWRNLRHSTDIVHRKKYNDKDKCIGMVLAGTWESKHQERGPMSYKNSQGPDKSVRPYSLIRTYFFRRYMLRHSI